MTNPAIESSGLTKRFGSTAVVDGLDLRVDRGTVLALLGPNDSGIMPLAVQALKRER
ncbi:hypothetical protein [Arthrobacter castelli]|uniref:hypothetical protein n=1 Tax=Arthrobacter castelli TaxID=271431 RepID=UPI000419C371|nr:hypothetical protein [Arthrobacter castelli]